MLPAGQVGTYKPYDRSLSSVTQFDTDRISEGAFKLALHKDDIPDLYQLPDSHQRPYSRHRRPIALEASVEWKSAFSLLLERLYHIAIPRTISRVPRRALRLRSWNEISISSGWSGNAVAEAAKSISHEWDFVDDLNQVTPEEVLVLEKMIDSAKDAETVFHRDIAACSDAITQTSLVAGANKNKVLYTYAQSVLHQIRIAQIVASEGADSPNLPNELDLLDETNLVLANAIMADAQLDGHTSLSVFYVPS